MIAAGEPIDLVANHHDKPITKQQVIGMVMLLGFRYPDLRSVSVEFSNRHTTRLCGMAHWSDNRIVLYRRGLDEGTVLHEMAHLLSPKREIHGPLFKAKFKELCEWWQTSGYTSA